MEAHMQSMQEDMKAMRGMGGHKTGMAGGGMMQYNGMVEHGNGGDDAGADDAA
jgi:hypothetical protein